MNLPAFIAACRAALDALEADPTQSGEPDYYSEASLPPGETSWSALLRRSRGGCFERRRLGRHVVIDGPSYRAWAAKRSTASSGVSTSSAEKLTKLGLRLVAGDRG